MFTRKKTLANISVGQLQIYLAVAKHDLRLALLEHRSLAAKIETLVIPDGRNWQRTSDPEIKMLVEREIKVRDNCNQLWKRIAVINLLLEFKSDLLQSDSHITSRHYKSFSEFMASKSLEDECRECDVASISINNKLERILLPHTPDKSEVQRVLRSIGLPEKEIYAVTNGYPIINPRKEEDSTESIRDASETVESEHPEMNGVKQKGRSVHLETH